MKFFQRLGRSLMLPVAVLPVAAVLSGFGYWIGNENIVGAFLSAAGLSLIDQIALLFAVGVAIGMATRSDGTSALAGLVSWLVVTKLLDPETIAGLRGIEVDAVDPAFDAAQNVFVGIICGLIGAWSYDKFKDAKLPDYLAFFSGKRSVAIVSAGLSLVAGVALMFIWPVVFNLLVRFGELVATMGPFGAGIYGFFNRLLIPLGLHHALNAVFWFDGFGIADLTTFLAGEGTHGVTGQYMTGFFPIMMFGLPGAALAMYVTAKSTRRKATAGILLSASVAAFLVGITEPIEFLFMFLAPGLFLVHALFTGISLAIAAMLPVRSGFGFSAGFIDLILSWANPMAQNPWAIFILGPIWFVVYFLVFRWIILKWDLKTPGREDEDPEDGADPGSAGAEASAESRASGSRFVDTAQKFLAALGGSDNIVEIENCATRLRMELADPALADEAALKRAGAAGVIKPGGKSYQVIYGLNVQFVKDAMERLMDGEQPGEAASAVSSAAADSSSVNGGTAVATVVRLRQPVEGRVVPLREVPDSTFADGLLGGGVAIEPTGDTVSAPAAGIVTQVFTTGHAVTLTLDDGIALLIHVGLDTVSMKGEGFEVLVADGERVAAGDPLVRFDRAAIERAGHSAITPVVVLEQPGAEIEFL